MHLFASLLLTAACFSLMTFAAPDLAAQDTRDTNRRRDTNATAPEISYTVSMPRPETHLLEVDMRVIARQGTLPANVDLVMPVWTPGSYLVREYARHVQDFGSFGVTTPDTFSAVPSRKINKNTWRIETNGAQGLSIRYRVYANELTVRTNELNDRHAFWNNAATLMYVDGFLGAPSTVRVRPFGSWKVATGLPAVANQPNTFRADNFDILYDSPFLASDHQVLTFPVRSVTHRFVIDGTGNYDAERFRTDVPKIIEAAAKLFGDLPYKDYTFILMTHPTARGGLEHLNSTALIWRRFDFRPDARYKDFLSLVSHEYFHLWNVKRIRPDALGPFDYSNENYTRLLWVAEGITSYYENLILRRAGLLTDREYLNTLAETISTIQRTPGRRVLSAEEASFDAWIKYYRPDENSINNQVSYYDKGALLGMLLDLEIRRRTDGARSLDDVMRTLYNDFAKRDRNYTPADFQQTAERIAGSSLAEFFARYVRGVEELPYDAILAAFGLTLDRTGGRTGAPRAYLGANLTQTGDRLAVTTVPSDSPAYEAGINSGDQILAIDGARVTQETLNARLSEHQPGDTIQLTVFRLDELRTIPVKLGAQTEGAYRILAAPNATADQRRLYEGWLGTQLNSLAAPRAAEEE